ncbi:MAG: AraC family transcriptional regulator, partial [Alphaproteobacteria bacterium]|nr:AraC family transcriptional regulator [Alphaproteobacteria bacterium]
KHRGTDFDVSLTQGLIRDARAPLSALQDNFSSFVFSISNDMLQRHAQALLGNAATSLPPQFEAKLDLSTPGGVHLRNTVHYIASALDGPLHMLNNSMVTDGMRDMFLTQVLGLLPNSYSDLLQRRPASGNILPYHVKRARDFIHAHADSAITLEQLASQAGCGYRTLQIAFNDIFGMSPMAYVRHIRLKLAHDDLRRADDDLSVRDIALKWGFTHMGGFSKAYQKQFGVLPSWTRRTHG